MANWQLDMDVVRQGLLLTKIQEGIAVDPLLVDSLLKNQGGEAPRLWFTSAERPQSFTYPQR